MNPLPRHSSITLVIVVGTWLGFQGAPAAPAATTQSGFRLVVEMQDGSKVIGRGADTSFRFRSELLGEIQMSLEKIRTIEGQARTNAVKLTTANGDTLTAQFTMKGIQVETAFGNFALPVELIRRVSVSAMRNPKSARPGLVGLWSAEGNFDDALGANDGMKVNRVPLVPGQVGRAFEFDGAGSYVKIPQSPELNLTEQVTIAFWMQARADNPMNTCCQGLVTTDFYVVEISGGAGRMGVNFAINTSAIQPTDRNGPRSSAPFTHISDANAGEAAQVAAGGWHHIAGTYDGSKLQLYMDGRPWGNPEVHSGRIPPMMEQSFLAIGSEDGRTYDPSVTGRYFRGQIDEVAIYNRALSAAEIQALCVEENNGELPPATTPEAGSRPMRIPTMNDMMNGPGAPNPTRGFQVPPNRGAR